MYCGMLLSKNGNEITVKPRQSDHLWDTCSNGRIIGVVGLTNFDKTWTNR